MASGPGVGAGAPLALRRASANIASASAAAPTACPNSPLPLVYPPSSAGDACDRAGGGPPAGSVARGGARRGG